MPKVDRINSKGDWKSLLLEKDRRCLALPEEGLHWSVERDAKENITNVEMSEITCCVCLWADFHTIIISLHHDWNQTALSGCVHLSSIHCHCVSLFTLQVDQNNNNIKIIAKIQSTTRGGSRAKDCFRTYHDHFQALFNWGSRLAFNVGVVLLHAVDAPCVALCCFSRSHGTPFNGSEDCGWGMFWRAKKTWELSANYGFGLLIKRRRKCRSMKRGTWC